ncbi:TRAP transporter permease [Virgifigura deserti]|uniref:TRAP transporter permease n=1 Tax=Virgifigura deserti TaxID=2268457 RepID=UPI003CCC2363
MDKTGSPNELTGRTAHDIAAEVDTGARHPVGSTGRVLMLTALAWSLFQLWYASPLPFMLNFFILNDTEARSIHLAFAVFLAFTAYPAFKRSPRGHVPLQDWAMALIGAFCAGYLFLFYRDLAQRPGLPTDLDLVVAVVGLVLLLEAARRTLGPALSIVALVFITYTFAGPYLPAMMSHGGASISRAMSQYWLTTEGVFGVALGVSSSFVFLFVLFGALLEVAGAGNYFIKLSFALLGHLRGGPAKAAVVSSGATGLISGSSIANVVTTGTFTIPLMKRVGYSPEKAGAVEVAASVNGQIMPPVMGAAAFLIAEYVGISYLEVVKHAFLPAIITYLALFYIVHIEALKANLQGLPRPHERTRIQGLVSFGMTLSGIIILAGMVYYGIGWTKQVFGDAATWAIAIVGAAVYIALMAYRARFPDLELDDPDAEVVSLPEAGPTAKTGLHFLLPVVVLVWCLMVERFSPGLSAFYGTVVMILILVTQRPLTQFFRGERRLAAPFLHGCRELLEGLVTGARNMIGIGIATAAAGIVVGTVSLTGVGLVMTELVNFLSGGYLMVMLLLTAFICLILGMGLPTTANYIVVATLMAPVVVELAAQNGLAVPLVAVHLFVFYFGLMADVTPPVGLASFAASAVSGADPIRTGVQAFRYEVRTALLPFIFIFNTQLLLIGIDNSAHLVLTVVSALAAMLLFVAATQNYFLVRSRWYETVALFLICFTLFRPGFWMDMLYPPFEVVPPSRLEQVVEATPPGDFLRLRATGQDFFTGRDVNKTVQLQLRGGDTPAERLRSTGLTTMVQGDEVAIMSVDFGSEAAAVGLDFGWTIQGIEVPTDRPAKEWLFLPALALLGLVVALQWRRRESAVRREASAV